jgi:hypothetical protein
VGFLRVFLPPAATDMRATPDRLGPRCGPLALPVRDRDSSRLEARVPDIVFGAYGDRIVPAILIIAPARGFQRHGEGIAAVRFEGQAAAWLKLAVLIHHHIRRAARLHPRAAAIRDLPRHRDGDPFPVGRRQRRGAGGDGNERWGHVHCSRCRHKALVRRRAQERPDDLACVVDPIGLGVSATRDGDNAIGVTRFEKALVPYRPLKVHDILTRVVDAIGDGQHGVRRIKGGERPVIV